MVSRSVLVALVLVGALTTGVLGTTNVVDLDGDRTPIVAELGQGTNPLAADSDDDGLDDGTEADYGTDPTVADSDGDGLDDGDEPIEYETDPLDADSDGDGLDDGVEVDEYGTDPLAADSDGDELPDPAELEAHGTDPTDADSDDDGLEDGAEVEAYGTDPTDADSDDDRLDDSDEIEAGTNPQTRDTDDDGLWDGMEVHERDSLPDADPLRYDIYVEVDEMERQTFSSRAADRVVSEFADAPVENADGSTGIDLHFVRSDDAVPYDSATDFEEEFPTIRREHFDKYGHGYHYLLIVDDIDSSHEEPGTTAVGMADLGEMVVQDLPDEDDTGATVMHELGHSLGLSSQNFHGVDSEEVPFSDYPSVMNYNAPMDYYGFSDGSHGPGDHDDWSYIEQRWYTPDTTRLMG